jgi:DDE superfamily endonuclease
VNAALRANISETGLVLLINEEAQIHWLDEMGLRSDHQTGRSYGRRGETLVVLGTGQRFRCNMISSITNRWRLAFMIFRQRFTARVFLNFLWPPVALDAED